MGSSIVRALRAHGFDNLLLPTHGELDLTISSDVTEFFQKEKPEYVFLAAAKVGGIHANNTFPVDFLVDNLMIELNVIRSSYKHRVKKLLFLGSSCIYPRMAKQPMDEGQLLTGELEKTNKAYALAKIAGIELCQSYNRQYNTNYISAMPTNLYGLNDNYHPEHSHVIPGLIRRFHEAKVNEQPKVAMWGTGKPLREFLYSDDLAEACLFLMNNYDESEIINIGSGSEISIYDLAKTIKEVVGYKGEIELDSSKPDGTPRKLLDSSKINQLGWSPRVGLKEGLQLAYKDFLEKHAK